MTYIVSFITSFIIALSITIVNLLDKKIVISLLLATFISLLFILVIYSIIGKIYLKKSLIKEKENLQNKKQKRKIKKSNINNAKRTNKKK